MENGKYYITGEKRNSLWHETRLSNRSAFGPGALVSCHVFSGELLSITRLNIEPLTVDIGVLLAV